MATPTTNYNFLKPATGETYDVNLLDTNYDKIDAALGNTDARVKKSAKIIGWDGGATWGNPAVPATSDMQEVIGSQSILTDAQGYFAVNMTGTFANGYLVVGLLNGDVAAQANVTLALSTGIFTNTANKFYVRATNAGTGAAISSANVRVNYIVRGW